MYYYETNWIKTVKMNILSIVVFSLISFAYTKKEDTGKPNLVDTPLVISPPTSEGKEKVFPFSRLGPNG